jgi:hypothetical protein
MLFLSGLFLCVNPLQARIGESQEECIARYGSVVEKRPAKLAESEPDALIFSKGGVTVWIEFQKGKAWRVVFRKSDLTATEVDGLLRANMPVGGWGASMDVNGRFCRRSFDAELLAIVTPPQNPRDPVFLEIVNREYADANYATYLLKAEGVKSSNPKSSTPASLEGF